MKKMLIVGLFFVGLLTGGCSNVVPTYSSSLHNVRKVKEISSSVSPVNIGKFTDNIGNETSLTCRGSLNIVTPHGETFAKYIEDALATELEMGNMLNPNSKVTISGNLKNIYSSSMLGDSYWAFEVKIISSNGKSFDVVSRYDYPSAFDGYSACNNMNTTYATAVQELINQILTNPQFSILMQ